MQDDFLPAQVRATDPYRRGRLAEGEGEKLCLQCKQPMFRKRWFPVYGPQGAGNPNRRHRKTGILESRANFARRQFCSTECSGRFAAEQLCSFPGCSSRGRKTTVTWDLEKQGPYCGGHQVLQEMRNHIAAYEANGLWQIDMPFYPDDLLIDDAEPDPPQVQAMLEDLISELESLYEAYPALFASYKRDSEAFRTVRLEIIRKHGAEERVFA